MRTSTSPRAERASAREVVAFVWRRDGADAKVLLARRCLALGGYWHPIAGAVEADETAEQAVVRELDEETGLDGLGRLAPRSHTFSYARAGASEAHASEPRLVDVTCFRVDVSPEWEPRLDWEHEESRWCGIDEAVRLLHWPLLSQALLELAGRGPGRKTA